MVFLPGCDYILVWLATKFLRLVATKNIDHSPLIRVSQVTPAKTKIALENHGKSICWTRFFMIFQHRNSPKKSQLRKPTDLPSSTTCGQATTSLRAGCTGVTKYISPNGIIFRQPRFPWNQGSHFPYSTTIWGKSVVWGRDEIWPEKWDARINFCVSFLSRITTERNKTLGTFHSDIVKFQAWYLPWKSRPKISPPKMCTVHQPPQRLQVTRSGFPKPTRLTGWLKA